MGDEKDLSATTAPSEAPAAPRPQPVSMPPRPVSIPPRPGSGSAPSRMPPPPSARLVPPLTATPFAPGVAPAPVRSAPPPPPLRQPPAEVAAPPSVVPRAPATPPPPPHRPSVPAVTRPSVQPMSVSATAQLEQRLGATQIELRKLGSERHTLRARLRRETDRVRELESALRAEKDLRRRASEENLAALSGLRQRLAELELELESARAAPAPAPAPAAVVTERPAKVVLGLRRIRGIGPGYQRLLEQHGVTRVQQVAAWSAADVVSFAGKLRIKPERINKDDWVGQAKALDPDPED